MISRFSVRFYLAVGYAVFILVMLGGSSLFWYSQQEQLAEDSLRHQLEERAELLATTGEFDTQGDFRPSLPTTYTAFNSNLRLLYLTPDHEIKNLSGHEISDGERSLAISLGSHAFGEERLSREVYGDPNKETLYAASPVRNNEGKIVGVICLILPLDDFQAAMDRSKRDLLVGSGVLATTGLLLGLIMATLLTHPLTEAQRLAARVANGDYSLRLPTSGPRELSELSGHLNRMAEELEEQTAIRERVLANVTHELARPLGGLQVGVETLIAGAVKDSELANDLLESMGDTIQKMSGLVDDLALAARPVAYPVKLNQEPVAIGPLLRSVKTRFRSRALARGIDLQVQFTENLPMIEADERRLAQIVANLVDNAMKFTPTGGNVTLTAQAVKGGVRISVQDTGPGILDHELGHVLEPFSQGTNTGQMSQGMGLGLSIARQLARAHGGRLELTNLPGGGLVASLILPYPQTTSSEGPSQ